MADTPRPYKRKKASAGAVAVATAIADALLEVKASDDAEMDESAPAAPVAQYRAPVAIAAVPSVAQARTVKVKATETVRGVYGSFRYAIEAGQTYNLPEPVASWLVSVGRAI